MIANTKNSIVRAASIVGFFTLLSRLIGLYRDRVFASTFGAGDLLDSYYTAFRIPDFFFNLLILGTLSVAFIPVFTEYFVKDPEEANRISNTIIYVSFLAMAGLMVIIFPFVPVLSKLIAHGFSAQKLQTTITLTRIFLLSPIIFTVSSVFSSILNSLKRFLVVSVAPIIYNFGIIFGVLFLYPRYGIIGIGWGVILGALGHLAIQMVATLRGGFKFKPELALRHPGVRKIMKLFLPRIFGIDNSQFSLLIASIVGSGLISGSIAIFNLANNLQAVPIGIFALSFAVAAFPSLSESFVRGDDKQFNHQLVRTVVNILFFAIPISIMIILLRAQIIRVVLGAGRFDWDATKLTANALGIFALSIFAQSLTPLFSRAFFARQNTIIPVIIGLLSLGANLLFSYILAARFSVLGLAAGFTISNVLGTAALYLLLRREIKHLDDHYLADSVLKVLLASMVMGASMYVVQSYFGQILPLTTGIHVLIQGLVSALVGAAIFTLCSFLLDIDQTRLVFSFLRDRVWKKMLIRDHSGEE